jgi:hypothetical protein
VQHSLYDTYTVLHTMIDGHRSYAPFWLLGVVGADLRPNTNKKRFFRRVTGQPSHQLKSLSSLRPSVQLSLIEVDADANAEATQA